MSTMRKNNFTNRWVIVADGDGLQPTNLHFKKFERWTDFCPFCKNNESATPAEIFAIRNRISSPNGPGWSVRVVPNSLPRLRIEGELARRAEGLHDLMNGVGAHEIIVETSRHDRNLHELEIEEISDVIKAYIARIVDLEGDRRVRYVLIFKNHGEGAGANTISHSISQLIALPITPRAVKTKLMIARDYFALKERCIYCDVIQQELKGGKRLISQNEDFVAFAPFASRFPFEMCILPKFHSSAFSRMGANQSRNLALILRDVLQKLDQEVGGPPYNCRCTTDHFCVQEGTTGTLSKRTSIGISKSCPNCLVLRDSSGRQDSSTTPCHRKSPFAAFLWRGSPSVLTWQFPPTGRVFQDCLDCREQNFGTVPFIQ
jgi:UDPglucose--hexose-1-phosphate uridylyltransferase